MRLFSWNVNGIRAVLRKGALQDFILSSRPDILCLQEIKATPSQVDYDFPGYTVYWNSATRPGYSGTATLVKSSLSVTPFDYISSMAFPSPPALSDTFLTLMASEGRVLILDCNLFYLVNVYTPNSKPDLSRLDLRATSWDPSFRQLLKNLQQIKPVVTCGDFNAAHHEIDLARPGANHHSAGFTDEERRGITSLIGAGFLDTFRTLHKDAVRYTWWSHWGQARARNVGWRIDYFFISGSLKPYLKDAEIYENIMGSDHCPISITLEF